MCSLGIPRDDSAVSWDPLSSGAAIQGEGVVKKRTETNTKGKDYNSSSFFIWIW